MGKKDEDSLCCEDEKEPLGNGTHCENNYCRPVSPFASGQGLPYAPEGWPEPGDIWGWKVGRRFSKRTSIGYYIDRYLYPPNSLKKKPSCPKKFQSLPEVERFLKNNYPEMDLKAFWDLFTWKVPSNIPTPSKVKTPETENEETKEICVRRKQKGNEKSPKQHTQKSFKIKFPSIIKQDEDPIPETKYEEKEDICVQRKRKWNEKSPKQHTQKSFRIKFSSIKQDEDQISETKNEEMEEICVQRKRKGNEKSPKQHTQKSFRIKFPSIKQDEDPTIQFCSINERASPPIESTEDLYLKSFSGSESDQFWSCDNGSPENGFISTFCPSKEESDIQTEPEKSSNGIYRDDFDDCFSSLEDIVDLPCTKTSLTNSMMSYTAVENEKTNCMKKLSMHLAMDFRYLVSSDNLAELYSLASQVRKDYSLTEDQVTKLKLIEEIPFISKDFLKAKRNIELADKFFAHLEAKKAEITCLMEQDSELKDKVAEIQAGIDSSVITIQEIDNQILQFQSKLDKMFSELETKKNIKAELTNAQTRISNSIRTMDNQIQLNLSKKPKWERKKTKSLRREAEILDKFATLRELTF